MKRLSITKISVLFLAALFIGSCQPKDSQDNVAEESFGAAPVKVYKINRQRISENLFYMGLIEAWKERNISPDVAGKIAAIYVEEGDRVQKGQLLAELDTRAIRLQLDQARAGVAVAEANYNDTKRNVERMDRLSLENAVSEQQAEKISLAFDAAEAQLQQAKASLNLANYQLDVSLMKAPIAGIIAARNVEVGDMFNPMMGGTGVLTLVDFSRVKIGIDVSHRDIIRISKGQPALLKVSAFPDEIFNGIVSVVNLAADSLTKKFRVEVEMNNPDLILRPNTFGEVMFEVEIHENVFVVPQIAVIDNKFVFVANGDRAEKRDVVLGIQNAEMVEIVSGIVEGDLVIIEGNFSMDDGTEIKIKEVIQ
ncbi:MAG: efflux RND transporter periplasmic adaptor subunit [Candidatus Aminicenantes bacterium]|nr:efflux RND transporter periplasmic adaptor subunit [Candidatus Aminicenantes bacterium]